MSTSASSPQKRGGTPDVTTLTNEYTAYAEEIETAPLPTYRATELAGQVRTVRDRLDADAAVPATALQRLLAVVAEAVGDVTAAEIDREADADNDADDDSRTLDAVVPGASDASDHAPYRLTPAERDALLETLVELLFTVVETPTASPATDGAAATDTDPPDDDTDDTRAPTADTDEAPAE